MTVSHSAYLDLVKENAGLKEQLADALTTCFQASGMYAKVARELDAARERETQLIANLSDMSDDILTLQTKLLAMEETLKALQRDDGHYLECPAPNLDTHATMPRSKNVQRCILLRAALGSPQEPQA